MTTEVDSKKHAEWVAAFADEKKADRIIIMDMRHVSGACDYFVICSATSSVRAKTIAANIEKRMKEEGLPVSHREGHREGLWILLDFDEVVVHVFQEDTRKYYSLEQLWGDAPQKEFPG